MAIEVKDGTFNNIVEIWEIGTNTLEVYTENNRKFRVHAAKNIRSGSTPLYHAHYEERVEINDKHLYVDAPDMPWANGNSVEDVLLRALGWIDDRGASKE